MQKYLRIVRFITALGLLFVLVCGSLSAFSTVRDISNTVQPFADSIAPGDLGDSAGESLTLVFVPLDALPAFYAADAEPNALHPNAMELQKGWHLGDVIVSIWQNGNWVEITEDNNSDLPANAQYQFEFSYRDVSVGTLKESGNQMVYKSLPSWFNAISSGILLYEDEIVARLEVIDGAIVITFDEAWLNTHEDDVVLNGTFRVSGSVDWHELPDSGGEVKLPDVDVSFEFEHDLAQKYANASIEKTCAELVESNGKYYLKYEITVTNEENVDIPDVTVRDVFANLDYVDSYYGVWSDGADLLTAESGLYPWETSNSQSSAPGRISASNGNMIWDIGTLAAGESRTLTYYAQISDAYIENLINNPIQNSAYLYAGENLKDVDNDFFIPKNDVLITKSSDKSVIEPNGEGYVFYVITIEAQKDNSFVLNDLVLKDIFPEDLIPYVSGGADGKIVIDIDGEERAVDYRNGSFTLDGITIEPGQIITVKYEVAVKDIFLAGNGYVTFTNTASIGKGDRVLNASTNEEILQTNIWTRKYVGKALADDRDIPLEGDVYRRDGSKDDNPPSSFTVQEGSIEYQIVVNENGRWDLSAAALRDEFSNGHLTYEGYICIQLYEYENENSADLQDADLIDDIKKSPVVRTIWLEADGDGSFSFNPSDFGIGAEDSSYAYLLTYYAKPTDVENVNSVTVSNSFRLEGRVGVGDGEFADLPGIEVSVGSVVRGGANYNAQKNSWYFALDAWEKDADGNPTVDVWPTESPYAKYGALYWVIRLDGTIPKDFVVMDTAAGNIQYAYDSIPVVFRGPKSFDCTGYTSIADLLKEIDNNDALTGLDGNPYNGRWWNSGKRIPEMTYWWQLETNGSGGPLSVTFQNSVPLAGDQAVYIIVRSSPTVLPASNSSVTYSNLLSVGTGSDIFPAGGASYTYANYTSLFKESKGAYLYDAEKGEFTSCSTQQGGDWIADRKFDRRALPGTGIYASWLVNVNYNGSMSGDADIIDYLPEGMELVYVYVNNYGGAIKSDDSLWPKMEYITELNNDPQWKEFIKDCTVEGRTVTAITYYNEDRREIRWHISGFTSAEEAANRRREINLGIICRVVDPELFLSGVGKKYTNDAAIVDPDTLLPVELEHANVDIRFPMSKSLDEAALKLLYGSVDGNKISGIFNRIPFTIEINPYGMDMIDGDVLPALIDELGTSMILIEDSLKVTSLGRDVGFTYTVREENGRQSLIIYDLPDGVPLTISYQVRVDVEPNVPVDISNTAYWMGNPPPNGPQVSDKVFEYSPSGDVFTGGSRTQMSVEITKVDADSHSKKLNGAVFELYEVLEDGSLSKAPVRSGTTDSLGRVVFEEDGEETLKLNTVYCIKEASAPLGYAAVGGKFERYFVIVPPNTEPNTCGIQDIDIWYDSPVYSIVVENVKGRKIGVEKVFVTSSGETFVPTSGTYRFGLFDLNGNLLETLAIQYTANGILYYLDGFPADGPYFTKYEPDQIYHIYELDEYDNPMREGSQSSLNDWTYYVSYATEDVVANGVPVKITNSETHILRVTKRLSGSMADFTEVFHFEIQFALPEDGQEDFPIAYKMSDGTSGEVGEDFKLSFELGHDDWIEFYGLAEGARYSVTELDGEEKGYRVSCEGDDFQGSIDGKNVNVVAVNAKVGVVPTGVFVNWIVFMWIAIGSLCMITLLLIRICKRR